MSSVLKLSHELDKRLPNMYTRCELQPNNTLLIDWSVYNFCGYIIVEEYNKVTVEQVADEIIRQAQLTLKEITTNNLQ